MRVYQTRTPLRYFQIDPNASRYVVARNEKSYSKYQKVAKKFPINLWKALVIFNSPRFPDFQISCVGKHI